MRSLLARRSFAFVLGPVLFAIGGLAGCEDLGPASAEAGEGAGPGAVCVTGDGPLPTRTPNELVAAVRAAHARGASLDHLVEWGDCPEAERASYRAATRAFLASPSLEVRYAALPGGAEPIRYERGDGTNVETWRPTLPATGWITLEMPGDEGGALAGDFLVGRAPDGGYRLCIAEPE